MTTTVLIGTQGNKAVSVKGPQGEFVMQPGRWFTLGIHGAQVLSIQEVGEFIETKSGIERLPTPPVTP
jgi:hypothetical protein